MAKYMWAFIVNSLHSGLLEFVFAEFAGSFENVRVEDVLKVDHFGIGVGSFEEHASDRGGEFEFITLHV